MENRLSYEVRAMRIDEDLWHQLSAIKYEKRITWNRFMQVLLAAYLKK